MSGKRRGNSLKDRVAHAYFMYGRFCSSHPVLCMLVSIFTLLFLSYPVTRLGLPTSSPLDIYWADHPQNSLIHTQKPLPPWLSVPPRLYVQQVLVRAKINPWDPRKVQNPELVVKGSLSRAFTLNEKLNNLIIEKKRLDDFCMLIHNVPSAKLLPSHNCLLLSPALFWSNDIQKFFEDSQVLNRIFAPSCTSAMCTRDLLFGLPTWMTGVKRQYRTNRERTITFAFTAILADYDKQFWSAIRTYFNSSEEFQLSEFSENDQKFVHIFYRSRKELSEYFPLAVSYCVLLIYVYFSANKIQLVKSKWGLAFSAVFTVAASLIMAAGICFQFDLTPTLWGAELFPYLAMIVGLENTLCITRSVVKTPVSMEVRSRIAHGLSKEGWSITKNFLTELLIITVGFFTFVPEIQEFCTFACIGLVVDFYMQLFFYAPCLTFDLLRIDSHDKEQINLCQLSTSPMELEVYPAVRCPVVSMFPRLFSMPQDSTGGNRMTRARSDSGISSSSGGGQHTQHQTTGGGHRRTASNSSDTFVDLEPRHIFRVLPGQVSLPRRLRVLYFCAQTRMFQRCLMVVTVLWIVWLAFIVHELQLIGQVSKVFRGPDSKAEPPQPLPVPPHPAQPEVEASGEVFTGSKRIHEIAASLGGSRDSAPLEWGSWQRRTFKWWPLLLDQYNISLSGHYLTILPPVILKAEISPDDPAVVSSGGHEPTEDQKESKVELEVPEKTSGPLSFFPMNSDLPVRISWLELQMTIVLVMSISIFATVAAFILYVCFGGRGSSRSEMEDTSFPRHTSKPTHRRVGSKAIVESVPLVFEGHQRDVECMCKLGQDLVVSSCLGGAIRVWDAKTGDCVKRFDRRVLRPPPRTWSGTERPFASENVIPQSSTEDQSPNIIRQRRVNPNGLIGSQIHANQSQQPGTRNPGYDFSPFVSGGRLQHQNMANARANGGPPLLLLDLDNEDLRCTPIWCLTAHRNLIAAGCANGHVELYSSSGALLNIYKQDPRALGGAEGLQGVNQVCLRGARLVLARLNGVVEFVELTVIPGAGCEVESCAQFQCNLLRTLRAHQHPINCMKMTASVVLITGSTDHTLKLLDLRTCSVTKTLYGHNGPVVSICIDEPLQVFYSSCDEGLVCCWDLTSGSLLRTLPEASYTNFPLALAVTNSLLVAYSSDCHLWLWHKTTGELLTRIRREITSEELNTAGSSIFATFRGNKKEKQVRKMIGGNCNMNSPGGLEVPCLVVLEENDDFAVTGCSGLLQFWSLQYKMLLREVKLESNGASVRGLMMMDATNSPSVICCKGKSLFRVNFPIIRFK